MPPAAPSPYLCTIVTCYYRSPAKHSNANYDQWMHNFLTTVKNPMVIFCDEESFEQITALRATLEDITKIYILPLDETVCGRSTIDAIWAKDWQRDIERAIHNPNLYIIWNEKSMFVFRAMARDPFNTEFFCWCDIGCFRDARPEELNLFQKEWPSRAFLEQARKDKMYFLNITPFEASDLMVLENGLTQSFERVTRIGATIFLGHRNVFEQWVHLYYKTLDNYIVNDYFAGKDQNIIATMYVLYPEIFKLVTPVPGEGNPWFYLQRHFLKAE